MYVCNTHYTYAYVTLRMGGSKRKFCYKGDVAHIDVLQLPWCATTSHKNAYNYARTTNGMHQVKLPLFIKHAISISIVTGFAKRGLIHASNFATLMRHNFICGSAMKLKFTVILV